MPALEDFYRASQFGAQLGQAARRGKERREEKQFNNRLAEPLAAGDYEGASKVAFESGRVNEGMSFQQFAKQQAQQDAAAARQADENFRKDYSTVVDTFARLDALRSRGVLDDEKYQAAVMNAAQTMKPLMSSNPKLAEAMPGLLQHVNGAPPGTIAAYNDEFSKLMFEDADPNKKADLDLKRSRLALDNKKYALEVNEFEEKLKSAKEPKPADFKDVQALRKEWNSVTGEFQEIRRSINNINTVAARKDSASDLALVVAFTKLLDPGSVAREGEVALTQSAASALDRAKTFVPRLEKGKTLLPDETRKALVEAANALASQYDSAFQNRTSEYGAIAERYFPGEEKSMILIGAGDPRAANPAASPSAAAQGQQGPQVGDIEDGYRYLGGNKADPNSWERV